MSISAIVLAVMLLTKPDAPPDISRAMAVAADADSGVATTTSPVRGAHAMRIRAAHCDVDRTEGVAYFEGDVRVDYSDAVCSLNADRLFVFMHGTNALTRIVATGHVAITNEMRVGTCASAVYHNKRREMEMIGDEGVPARLWDRSTQNDALEGATIRFWFDSEQVEVKSSRIKFEDKKGKDLL